MAGQQDKDERTLTVLLAWLAVLLAGMLLGYVALSCRAAGAATQPPTVYRMLTVTLPRYDGLPGCMVSAMPLGDQLYWLSAQCSHDSLTWHEVCRWGLRHAAAGSKFTFAAWPDTAHPVWYRVAAVDTSGNVACYGNAVRAR